MKIKDNPKREEENSRSYTGVMERAKVEEAKVKKAIPRTYRYNVLEKDLD
jgi:hypothetical protein